MSGEVIQTPRFSLLQRTLEVIDEFTCVTNYDITEKKIAYYIKYLSTEKRLPVHQHSKITM